MGKDAKNGPTQTFSGEIGVKKKSQTDRIGSEKV